MVMEYPLLLVLCSRLSVHLYCLEVLRHQMSRYLPFCMSWGIWSVKIHIVTIYYWCFHDYILITQSLLSFAGNWIPSRSSISMYKNVGANSARHHSILLSHDRRGVCRRNTEAECVSCPVSVIYWNFGCYLVFHFVYSFRAQNGVHFFSIHWSLYALLLCERQHCRGEEGWIRGRQCIRRKVRWKGMFRLAVL